MQYLMQQQKMGMHSKKLLKNLTSELQFPTTRIPRIENESKLWK